MPIKLPKSFARRKSASNALETLEDDSPSAAGSSSFRVLSREDGKVVGARPNSSAGQDWSSRSIYDGEGLGSRTNKSSSTAYTSSSDRYSYQSTEPSSVDSRSQDDLVYKKASYPYPSPPEDEEEEDSLFDARPRQRHRFSLTAAAGKNFALPRPRFNKANSSPSRRENDAQGYSRDRSMTTSSYSSYASTAHPPRPDAGLDMGKRKDDGSGLWIPSTIWQKPIAVESDTFHPPLPPLPAARTGFGSNPAPQQAAAWEAHDDRPAVPLSSRLQDSPSPHRQWQGQNSRLHRSSQLLDDQSKDILAPEAGRRSWDSNQSEKGLASDSVRRKPAADGTPRLRTSWDDRPQSYSPQAQESPSLHATADQGLLDALAASQALDEEYAVQPAQYLPERSLPGAQNHTGQSPVSRRTPQIDVSRTDSQHSSNVTTPKAQHATLRRGGEDPMDDITRRRQTYAANARKSMLPQGNKVMTKAEFENYKRTTKSHDDVDERSEKSDEEDNYDDVDEKERTRQIVKQRRKQEANLAVYRQQMMKVTGEQSSDLPSLTAGRPSVSRSTQSLPSLGSFANIDPTHDPKAEVSGKSSEDEDEDVPLGVLQAHGFPSKSRPPTRLTSSSTMAGSRPESQLSAYPSPLGATRNDSAAGGGPNTGLPPFARGLPRDPYVGASLVNQPTRQSFQPASSLPPGGLVGVIAGEERAKAMRRGSPNVNGTYGPATPPMQPQMISQMPHPGVLYPQMGMPFMSQQQQYSPSQQAQMDMNNSMTQMMQMQMQWMQQMQQMMQAQGMSGMPPLPFPPGMMPTQGDQQQAQAGTQAPNNFWSSMSFEQQNNRDSTLNAASSTNAYQQQHQRSPSGMSAYNPNSNRSSSFLSPFNTPNQYGNIAGPRSSYTPSIAPSERSNVGQPSRYRSVTPANPLNNASNSRTQTMSSSLTPGQNLQRPRSRSPEKLGLPLNAGQGLGAVPNPATIRAVSRPRKGNGPGSDDDEDDSAWAEMKKRRDERRSRWTARKQEKENEQLPKEGYEGLYFEG